MIEVDAAVIGAGIAGASAAAELARDRRVALLEREDQPGYHATGRSAALFSKTYGPGPIRALSRASEAFFLAPPEGFADHPILTPRGVLTIARPDQAAALDAMIEDLSGRARVARLSPAEAARLLPILRADALAGAMLDDEARDIDVHALHQGFLRAFRARGGRLVARAETLGLTRVAGGWEVETAAGPVRAEVVVNAAGAWADAVGAMAGARPVGLTPRRRTAMIVAAPEGASPGGWRMAVDVEETFYLKPDAGKLLISPADETPSAPCDAQPEELDIAVCVDRIERAFDLKVRRVERSWAGLRSFVADKCPAIGWDEAAEGFFWLAGQGGYGIQTAPAAGRLAAALVRGEGAPADIEAEGLEAAALSPARLAA